VRKPVIALACAIILQLALFQAARAGDSSAAAVNASRSATGLDNPGKHLGWCDPQLPNGKDIKGHPQCSRTSVPPGSVPPGSVPPGSVPPGSVPPGSVPPGSVPPTSQPTGLGTFSRSPASGPVGTIIHVASVTPSPLGGEQIATVVLFDLDPGVVASITLPVSSSGAWEGSIVVPSNADVGAYELRASVQGVAGGPEFGYNALPFSVVPSGGAPSRQLRPPPPVVKPPTLTG
jgi:hypothetical protein